MVAGKYCTVGAVFDSGTFLHFGVSAPLQPHQYTNSIQDEYNLSSEDFTALEILINHTIGEYLKEKK